MGLRLGSRLEGGQVSLHGNHRYVADKPICSLAVGSTPVRVRGGQKLECVAGISMLSKGRSDILGSKVS